MEPPMLYPKAAGLSVLRVCGSLLAKRALMKELNQTTLACGLFQQTFATLCWRSHLRPCLIQLPKSLRKFIYDYATDPLRNKFYNHANRAFIDACGWHRTILPRLDSERADEESARHLSPRA